MKMSTLKNDALEKAAKHRGRAYQCLRCLDQHGKEVIDVKSRIEDHIMKHHLSLDQVPFYCNLCLFKCKDLTTLQEHVGKFSRHALVASEKGISANCQDDYLKQNPNPYQIGKADYYILSQEDSTRYFIQKTHNKKTSLKNQDLLTEAVREIWSPINEDTFLESETPSSQQALKFVSGLEPAIALPEEASQMISSFLLNFMQKFPIQQGKAGVAATTTVSAAVPENPVSDSVTASEVVPSATVSDIHTTAISPVSIQLRSTPVSTASRISAPVVTQESLITMIPTAPVTTMIPVQLASSSTSPLVSAPLPVPPPSLFRPWQKSVAQTDPLSLPRTSQSLVCQEPLKPSAVSFSPRSSLSTPILAVRSPNEEQKTDQTHGRTTETLSVPGPDMEEDILHQLLGEDEEPIEDQRMVNVVSHCPSSVTDNHRSTSKFNILKDAILESNRSLRGELEKNSRAIRCLEKSVQEQTQVLRSIQSTFETLASTLQNSSRDEWKKHDSRDVERQRERYGYRQREREENRQRERGENRKREEASKQPEEKKRKREVSPRRESRENITPLRLKIFGQQNNTFKKRK